MSAVLTKKVDCKKFLKDLIDFIDGQLEGKSYYEFKEHLALCPKCKEFVSDYSVVLATMRTTLKKIGKSQIIEGRKFIPIHKRKF